jgi:hypothetical protein
MGTTLTGTTPQDTYDSLIKVTDNGPLSGTAKYLSDGLGNDSALALSTSRVGIGTSAPSGKLNLVQTASTTVPALKIESSGTLANNDILRVQINGVTNGFRIFQNASSEVKYTFSDGQMGVGTEAPAVPLDVVGNIRSSTGILFGSDTAAANALDDYEEGTWTMGISFGNASTGITYTRNTGTYTKIGRQVTVQGYLTLSSKGSASGGARITGLPFTISNNAAAYSAATMWLNNISFANQYNAISQIGSTNIEFYEVTEAGVFSALTDADFANTSEVIFTMSYIA